MSDPERRSLLKNRRARGEPWHAPQHRKGILTCEFHLTAACFEHRPVIGKTPARMDGFAEALLGHCADHGAQVRAWCLLPDHYHLLVRCADVLAFLPTLGRIHGRFSFEWNREDGSQGRKVFFRAAEREMRGERHRFATINYIHHNPVHHGHVDDWLQWRWSSLRKFVEEQGAGETERIWKEYPIRNYGKGWDDPQV